MPDNFSILIVEDNDDARRNLEDILSLDGYQIESVSHCLPAIAAIESRHFDAVIVDWKLPDGSGRDLIPVIKRELPNTPVIVATGVREFDTAVSALRSGVYDFLTKPINPDALRMLMSRLVERKRHLNEIEAAQQQLVDSERLAAIGQMVAGLAHESRNAFQRSHACLAELSLDLGAMPESLKLVHKVQKALDDINLLLEEVRNYSAPIILERRRCDLHELVTETWQQVIDAKRPDVCPQFDIEVDSDVDQIAFIDGNRIGQVLRNLLENALFACGEPGRILVHIHLHPTSKGLFSVSVSDDGEGVPPENQQEIFGPFVTTKTKGTGLGLAISRRIIESHDGRIFVGDSEFGGAKFVFELPVISPAPRTRAG